MSKNRVYTLETKLEAIKLKQEGVPVKEIQETLNIKSESQVYFWWYWFRPQIDTTTRETIFIGLW